MRNKRKPVSSALLLSQVQSSLLNREQTRLDTRSDIYSLGVTFWYLLSGRVPFVGRTLEEIRERQAESLPVEQLKGLDVPARILALLKSMLGPDPKDRPQSARELLSAVHRCSHKIQHRSTFAAETIHPGCGRAQR